MALKVVLPVEKESLLLCGSDLLLHKVTVREFHLTDADGLYQNLRVNITSHRIVIESSIPQRFIHIYAFSIIHQ